MSQNAPEDASMIKHKVLVVKVVMVMTYELFAWYEPSLMMFLMKREVVMEVVLCCCCSGVVVMSG